VDLWRGAAASPPSSSATSFFSCCCRFPSTISCASPVAATVAQEPPSRALDPAGCRLCPPPSAPRPPAPPRRAVLALLRLTPWMTEEGAGGVDLAAPSPGMAESAVVVRTPLGTCAASLRFRRGCCSASVTAPHSASVTAPRSALTPHPCRSRWGADGEARGVEMESSRQDRRICGEQRAPWRRRARGEMAWDGGRQGTGGWH
jgi:hypothetical protein